MSIDKKLPKLKQSVALTYPHSGAATLELRDTHGWQRSARRGPFSAWCQHLRTMHQCKGGTWFHGLSWKGGISAWYTTT